MFDALEWPHTKSLWLCVIVGAVPVGLLGTLEYGYFFFMTWVLGGLFVGWLWGGLLDAMHPEPSGYMQTVRVLAWLQIVGVPGVGAIVLVSNLYSPPAEGFTIRAAFIYYIPILLLTSIETVLRIYQSLRRYFRTEESIANFYEGRGFDPLESVLDAPPEPQDDDDTERGLEPIVDTAGTATLSDEDGDGDRREEG